MEAIPDYDENQGLFFQDIIENIALTYIIRNEVKTNLKL